MRGESRLRVGGWVRWPETADRGVPDADGEWNRGTPDATPDGGGTAHPGGPEDAAPTGELPPADPAATRELPLVDPPDRYPPAGAGDPSGEPGRFEDRADEPWPEALLTDPEVEADDSAYRGRRRRGDPPHAVARAGSAERSRLEDWSWRTRSVAVGSWQATRSQAVRGWSAVRAWPAPRQRRVAAAALAVGVVLVGAGVVARLLEQEPVPAPLPTPPLGLDSSPGRGADRHGILPSASPRSPTPTPTPSPTGAEPPAPLAAYEAEAAQPGSHGQVTSMSGASGGQVVRLTGSARGAFVQFTGVAVPEAGDYQLTIRYFTDQPRRVATVVVNDGSPDSVSLPARTESDGIGAVALPVRLAAGDGNTVWIGTTGGSPVAIDAITITD